MESKGLEYYEEYRKTFHKYTQESPMKYRWNISMDEMIKIDNEIACLIPHKAKILEVGCGNGRTAEIIMNQRPDITFYHGIDFVAGSIKEAQEKNIRDTKIYRANYWDILSEDGEWDFVISCGVLFTCTNPEYKGLLMDLLDNTATRGYIVLSVITLKPRVAMLEKSYNNSINISEYYLKGKRTKFNFPERLYNHPFWIIREGIKNKNVPDVPDLLKGLPGDQEELFKKLFT